MQRLAQPNEAVMFDIDDTLIFTDGTPNIPIIELLHQCKRQGYIIVIITARPGNAAMIQYTKHELSSFGILYDHLGFCRASDKTLLKKHTGYTYVLSVGDQPTDLTDSQYIINTSSGTRNYYMSQRLS